MAIFRKVHVQFWSDVFIQTLTPEQKFFFLYLLTNERTKQCGIYEVTTRQISYDTGYNVETVLRLIEFFTQAKKVLYCRDTNEIAIKNWDKYNGSSSPKVKNLVNKEVKSIKSKKLLDWMESPDTVSIDYKTGYGVEVEPEQEPEREVEVAHDKTFDAEKTILDNPIRFEQIRMNTKFFDEKAARVVLRKFHLWLEEKGRYPQTKKQVFAGYEKWLMNEPKDEKLDSPKKRIVV